MFIDRLCMLWYSLEAPCRGASNEYPQHMFRGKIKLSISILFLTEEMHTFYHQKWKFPDKKNLTFSTFLLKT